MEHLTRVRRSGRTVVVAAVLAVVALLVPLWSGGLASAAPSHPAGPRPTIVLLHGDWADGSSWTGVIERLQRRGFTVVAPPNPLRGPTSYGGFVATNAATGNPNVKALVYIDAFVPDAGQTLLDLTAGSCVGAANAFNVVPSPGGVLDAYLNVEPNAPYTGFNDCFANGVG